MSVRNRRGNLQVATDIWHNPDQNKVVTLIGVVHIADQTFWEDTQKIITGCTDLGHEVHFEGTLHDVPNMKPFLPDYKDLANLMGLTSQDRGLNYSRAWKRTDVAMSFLIANAHPGKLAAAQARDWEGFIEKMQEQPWAGRLMHRALRYSHILPPRRHLMGIPRSIILHYRNRIAALEALNTSADVVAIWGADHIPGIGRHLAAAGYHRDYRIWRTAITKPGRQEN